MDNLPDDVLPIKGATDFVRLPDVAPYLDRDTFAAVAATARLDGLTGHKGALLIARDRLAELLGGQP
jgi:hypothetical protein